jgi:hypothetical protein
MLQVFKKEKERDLMKSKICKTSHGDYAPSGLTPPTYDIVKRRFEMTRINEDTFLPYKIRQVTEEILTLGQQANPKEEGSGGAGGSGGGGGAGGGKGTKLSKKAQKEQAKRDKEAGIFHHHDESKGENIRKVEKITEEIVDFEEWMIDPSNPTKGRTIIIDGKNWSSADAQLLIHHPELLITEEDIEEDELEELAKQQLRNKVAKQQQQQQQQQQSSSSSTQSTTSEQSSSSSTLPSLSINTNVLPEGEGTASSNNPIKLSLTLKRTPKNAPSTATEGEEHQQSGEEKTTETTGEVEEDKYAIEDTSENMEVDDAAMVADDDEENDEDEEEVVESEEDDDDDLENLILQKANKTGETAAGVVTTSSDAHVHVDHDDEEHGEEMEITEEAGVDHVPTSEDQVGLTVDDEEEEEEEWMKRV